MGEYNPDAEYIRALEQERDEWASRHASLERDLAELREAAREAIAAHNDEPDLGQGAEYDDAVQFARFCMAMDTLAALLPAEPRVALQSLNGGSDAEG